MATVNWNQGPWATQTQRPANATITQNPYAQMTSVSPPVVSGDTVEGGGTPGYGQSGPAASGPMGSEMGNYGQLGGWAAKTALGLGLGATLTPASFVGAVMPIASLISRAMGVQNVSNPFEGLSPMDEQGVRDIQGSFAADKVGEARREAESQNLGFDMPGNRESAPGGWGPSPDAPSVGVDPGRDPGTGPGGMGGASMGSDSASGGPGGFGGGPGGGPDVARGGVIQSKPGTPQRVRFGEGPASPEGETGIFVPEYMKAPGIQGNELQVVQGLLQALQKLIGPQQGGR